MFIRREVIARLALGVLTATALPGFAMAQDDFPSKDLQWVVPYSAGGGMDNWSRVVAEGLSQQIGQNVNVEVRAGAGGAIGWKYLLDQPADGYTLMIGSASPMIAVMSEETSPIKVTDVKIVNVLSDYNSQVMAQPGSDFDSWDKIKAFAEANPGKLTVGGTLSQSLAAASVMAQAGLQANFIPYPGTSAAVTDMLGGHINLAVVTPTTAVSLGDKAVPVLNVGPRANSEELTAELGEVPWVGDMGYEGMAQPRWIGVHPDTPDEIVAKLDAALKATLEDEATAKRIADMGEEIIYDSTPEATKTYGAIQKAIETYLPTMQ